MNLAGRVVVPLRVLLVMLFAGLVVARVMSMPGQFAYLARATTLRTDREAVI